DSGADMENGCSVICVAVETIGERANGGDNLGERDKEHQFIQRHFGPCFQPRSVLTPPASSLLSHSHCARALLGEPGCERLELHLPFLSRCTRAHGLVPEIYQGFACLKVGVMCERVKTGWVGGRQGRLQYYRQDRAGIEFIKMGILKARADLESRRGLRPEPQRFAKHNESPLLFPQRRHTDLAPGHISLWCEMSRRESPIINGACYSCFSRGQEACDFACLCLPPSALSQSNYPACLSSQTLLRCSLPLLPSFNPTENDKRAARERMDKPISRHLLINGMIASVSTDFSNRSPLFY
ncbi:hypothetical protein IRJ41_018529, partial [Triplophysa rosa]